MPFSGLRLRTGTVALLCGLASACLGVVHGQAVLPDSQPLQNLRLELQRSDTQQAALNALLQDQRTPGSGAYHVWLTPAQFAERFSPNAATREAALLWLQQQGFQGVTVSSNGMRLQFSGTVAQVRQAFALQLRPATRSNAAIIATPTASASTVHLPFAMKRLAGLSQDSAAAAAENLVSVVEANTAAAVVSDAPDTSSADTVADWQELLAEAAAQGITVLQAGGPGSDTADASAAVLLAGAAGDPDSSVQTRPVWQSSTGLPATNLRAVPDAVVDTAALARALNSFAAQHGRIGPLAPALYRLASGHGIFSHSEGTVAGDGVWAQADGLGTLNISKLVQALTTGTTTPNVALAASNTTITHGQALSLTYTVTGGGATPTGTVTATLSGRSGSTVTLGPATLNANGVATVSSTTLPGDVYDLSGTYSGDSTYAAVGSNTVTTTVLPESTLVTASAPATALGGTIPVTVTAASPSGVGVPSGAVTVTAYGASSTPATYSATLVASSARSASAVVRVPASVTGKFTFQANCTASASFACNQPQSFDVTVSPATPVVTLTSTPEAVVANSATQKYDLAVTVAAASGSTTTATPTGSVTITNNGSQVTTIALSKGAGTYTVSLSGTGNSLVASYSGDTNYAAASSSAVVVNAPLITTTTTLTGSPVSLSFGSTASLTASVTPASYVASGSPTGTITFTSSLQGAIGTATLGNGYVTYSLNNLQVGTHTITARYNGDSNYAPSVSSALVITVAMGQLATTTTLSILPLQPLAAQMTMLTATVTPNTAGLGVVCTGQVTFFSNGIFLGNGTLSSSSVSVQVQLPTATDSVTASYAGDSQCYGSTSAATVVTPARVASTLSLQTSAAYANAGQTIQLTATVGPAVSTQIGTPTGSVTFYALRGGVLTPIGTAALTTTGLNSAIAVLGVNGSSAGQQSFSAMYGGDTNFLPSTSATVLGNFGDFALTLNPSSTTIARGSTGTVAATLTVSNGFSGAVVLNCVPPASSLITCSFLPNTLVGGGSTTLTIKTTLTSAQVMHRDETQTVVACFGLLGALLTPLAWRRRSLATVLLACVCVLMAGGCSLTTVDSTNNLNSGSGSSPTSGSGGTTTTGTPLGTQLLTLTATSADGTLQHTYTYPLTVQ